MNKYYDVNATPFSVKKDAWDKEQDKFRALAIGGHTGTLESFFDMSLERQRPIIEEWYYYINK